MPIYLTAGDLLKQTDVDAIVNTVNCVGVMGKGIALMFKAHEQCPWNAQWRDDLARAYELSGEPEKAAALKPKKPHASVPDPEQEMDGEFAW